MSQAPEIPANLRGLMAELGPKWADNVAGHVALMIAGFSRVLAESPKASRVTRDIPYGDSPRQRLDAYLPDEISSHTPVLFFVHGGAFVEGNKNASSEIYGNVLHYAARHGIVGVNIEYRLADEAQYPGASEDIRDAIAYFMKNAGLFSIDTRSIFLMAHSAGGAHAATYAYGSLNAQSAYPLSGLIVVSGRVRADADPRNPNAEKVKAYYGADTSLFDQRSAVSLVGPDSVDTLIAYAEFDNPLLDEYSLELAESLRKAKGRSADILRLSGHNHTSIIAHINTADDDLGAAIRKFVWERSLSPGR